MLYPVPPITKWILKQFEFNKDVPITDEAQLTLLDIQLSTVFQTFRVYVKNLQDKAHARSETIDKSRPTFGKVHGVKY
jgi:hypothetical protein